MEHKIGTRITLEVVEDKEDNCEGCFFLDKGNGCCERAAVWNCGEESRSDHKGVIYKEIKEETK